MGDGWEEKVRNDVDDSYDEYFEDELEDDDKLDNIDDVDDDVVEEHISKKATINADEKLNEQFEKNVKISALSQQRLRQGFIMKEILGPPRCKQRRGLSNR